MARQGISPAAFGRVMAVNGVLIVTLQPFSDRFTRRFDPAHVLAAASLLVGVGYGAYTFCTTPLQYALATAVWSLGEILVMPVASALVAAGHLVAGHARRRRIYRHGQLRPAPGCSDRGQG